MKYKECIFLSAGHGGFDPVSMRYTTSPSKMWDHKVGEYHNGSIFYEGVSNRIIAHKFYKKAIQEGINVVKVYNPVEDTKLSDRVSLANNYHQNIQKGIYLSFHSDACGGCGARGISTYTSKGDTRSDSVAEVVLSDLKKNVSLFGSKWRFDKSDGDLDKEENFFELRMTNMPSILVENLFFDNYEDAGLLMDPCYQDVFTDSMLESFKKVLKTWQ